MTMLRDFILANRDEILREASERVAARTAPRATPTELKRGLPIFLDQLCDALERAARPAAAPEQREAIGATAGAHGKELFDDGLTVAQVVHDYGDLCQVITGLAVSQSAQIALEEFRTLNLCLDDAIAGAVTAYADRREQVIADHGVEQLGALAHEMRSHVNTAILTFSTIKKGVVAPGGSTSILHDRSLERMAALVDRSFAETRLAVGGHVLERVAVRELVHDVSIGAGMLADQRGLTLDVAPVDASLVVEADRQLLTAAIANLLQNAFKFTPNPGTVQLRVTSSTTRVCIEIEDQCGGLPTGGAERLMRPFVQAGSDRSGLGLGLAICAKAMKIMAGELRLEDLAGVGCIAIIDLPKQPPPPTSIHKHKPRSEEPTGGSGFNAATGT